MDYTIQKGDTLSKIATNNKTDIQSLLKLNPLIKDPNKIFAGQTIKLAGNTQGASSSILGSSKSSSGVTTSDPVTNQQNQSQQQSAQDLIDMDAEIAKLTKEKQLQDLKTSLSGGQTAPTPPNFENLYESLRTSQGVADLETQLNTAKQEQTKLQNDLLTAQHGEEGMGRPLEIVTGRKSKLAEQTNERLNTLTGVINSITDQLNTKNNYISTVMSLTQQDYQTASQQYNDNFSRNYQLFSALQTQQEKELTVANTQVKTLIDLHKDYPTAFQNPTQSDLANWNNLEMKAGLPQGFIQGIISITPKTDISHWVNGKDGNIYAFGTDKTTGQPVLLKTFKGLGINTSSLDTALKQGRLAIQSSTLRNQDYLAANRWMNFSGLKGDKTMAAFSGAAPLLSRIQAGIETIQKSGMNPVVAQDLLDSTTQLNRGGGQITEANVALLTQGQSFPDRSKILWNKLQGSGGVISEQDAKELVDLSKKTYSLYQKNYQDRRSLYEKSYKNTGLPNYLFPPDVSQAGVVGNVSNEDTTQLQNTINSLNTELGSEYSGDVGQMSLDQLQQLMEEGLVPNQ